LILESILRVTLVLAKTPRLIPPFLGSRGAGKANIKREVEENPPDVPYFYFAVKKITLEQHVVLRQKSWPLLRKKLRTEVLSGKIQS
jgi:hypothetical protein